MNPQKKQSGAGDQGDDLTVKTLTAERDELKAELDRVSKELLEVQPELERLKDLAGRSQADLQNAKDRLEREARDMRSFAVEGIIQKLLPTVDNFQRGFQHLPEDLAGHDWVKGIQAVEQDFIRLLGESGLSKIESIGQQVDPAKHEVLQAGPGEEGVISEVFEEGYELNGKVIRVARVKVGDGS